MTKSWFQSLGSNCSKWESVENAGGEDNREQTQPLPVPKGRLRKHCVIFVHPFVRITNL